MTDAQLIAAVNNILAESLDAAYWASIATAQQNAAITMAKRDVFAQLPGTTQESIAETDTKCPVICAIAEQAVFLLRTHEEQADGKVITGEGVEGLSVSYALLDAANAGMAPRAQQYIKLAKRQALARCRFVRG